MCYCTWEAEADGDNLGYAVSWRPPWATWDPISKGAGGGGGRDYPSEDTRSHKANLPDVCTREALGCLGRSLQPLIHPQMGSGRHPNPILLRCSGTPGSENHPHPHPRPRGVAGGHTAGLPFHSHCSALASSAGPCEVHVKKEAPREVRTAPEKQQGAAKWWPGLLTGEEG